MISAILLGIATGGLPPLYNKGGCTSGRSFGEFRQKAVVLAESLVACALNAPLIPLPSSIAYKELKSLVAA